MTPAMPVEFHVPHQVEVELELTSGVLEYLCSGRCAPAPLSDARGPGRWLTFHAYLASDRLPRNRAVGRGPSIALHTPRQHSTLCTWRYRVQELDMLSLAVSSSVPHLNRRLFKADPLLQRIVLGRERGSELVLAHVRARRGLDPRTHARARTHTHTHTYTHILTHACVCVCVRAHTHTHTCVRTRPRTHVGITGAPEMRHMRSATGQRGTQRTQAARSRATPRVSWHGMPCATYLHLLGLGLHVS